MFQCLPCSFYATLVWINCLPFDKAIASSEGNLITAVGKSVGTAEINCIRVQIWLILIGNDDEDMISYKPKTYPIQIQ